MCGAISGAWIPPGRYGHARNIHEQKSPCGERKTKGQDNREARGNAAGSGNPEKKPGGERLIQAWCEWRQPLAWFQYAALWSGYPLAAISPEERARRH